MRNSSTVAGALLQPQRQSRLQSDFWVWPRRPKIQQQAYLRCELTLVGYLQKPCMQTCNIHVHLLTKQNDVTQIQAQERIKHHVY